MSVPDRAWRMRSTIGGGMLQLPGLPIVLLSRPGSSSSTTNATSVPGISSALVVPQTLVLPCCATEAYYRPDLVAAQAASVPDMAQPVRRRVARSLYGAVVPASIPP
eukprot:3940740-Rhodomonas_salina.3